MGDRIINLQRRARELGRLRLGVYDGDHPARSRTFIVTSHSEAYVRAAADEWGGQPEEWEPQGDGPKQWRVITDSRELDAVLPPGDPLSQNFEMWSRGGCVRRCDSERERISDQPCVCRSEFGEDWQSVNEGKSPKNPDYKAICKVTTRLSVILPQMPDIGVWRLESGSYNAAVEISAHLDLIRSAIDERYAVPVRIRIEPRDKMVRGQPRHYSVPVVELRGVVAGQILSGTMAPEIGPDAARMPAITSEPEPNVVHTETPATDPDSPHVAEQTRTPTRAEFATLIGMATSPDQVKQLAKQATDAGLADDELKALANARWKTLKSEATPPAQDKPMDLDGLWSQIVSNSPFDTTDELDRDFWSVVSVMPRDADSGHMQQYLIHQRNEAKP